MPTYDLLGEICDLPEHHLSTGLGVKDLSQSTY